MRIRGSGSSFFFMSERGDFFFLGVCVLLCVERLKKGSSLGDLSREGFGRRVEKSRRCLWIGARCRGRIVFCPGLRNFS